MNILIVILLTIWAGGYLACLIVEKQIKTGSREASDKTLKKYDLEYDSDDQFVFDVMNASPIAFTIIAIIPIVNYLFAIYLALTHPRKENK